MQPLLLYLLLQNLLQNLLPPDVCMNDTASSQCSSSLSSPISLNSSSLLPSSSTHDEYSSSVSSDAEVPSLLCSPTQSFPDSVSPLAIDLQSLIETIVLPDAHWVFQNQDMNHLIVYKVSREPSSSLVITHSVRIKEDLTWSLSVHGFLVDSLKCGLLSDIPESMCQIPW